MNKKNQAGGHHTPQNGNKSGSSGEDRAGQQNQQSGSGGSSQRQADDGRQVNEANPDAQQAGSQAPKGNQGGK